MKDKMVYDGEIEGAIVNLEGVRKILQTYLWERSILINLLLKSGFKRDDLWRILSKTTNTIRPKKKSVEKLIETELRKIKG